MYPLVKKAILHKNGNFLCITLPLTNQGFPLNIEDILLMSSLQRIPPVYNYIAVSNICVIVKASCYYCDPLHFNKQVVVGSVRAVDKH